ncbi:MAG: HAD domain-containing protein [Baekduia sp.]
MAKPILLLDVDGVINCFGSIWTPEYNAEHFIGGGPCAVGDFQVHVRHETPGLIRELAEAFEVVWCTAWMEEAHLLKDLLGLPEEPWRHIEFTGWNGMLKQGGSWKLHHVAAWLEEFAPDRPAVWIDDDLGQPDLEWSKERSAQTTLFRPGPARGLTRTITNGALEIANDWNFAKFERGMLAQIDRTAELIASCHERVPCPRCEAEIGQRCCNVRRGFEGTRLKHPHKERWTQVVPAR